MSKAKTLGELKKSGYKSRSIKEELRENLITKLQNKETVFKGILGFDDTVIPDLERAILSRHNVLLLGLRGQAKTRLARLLVSLLDEHMPVVAGSELNDDPLQPLSIFAQNLIAEKGDDTPITWVHRDDRYVEKLATPDVSIADLVGDVDPIKAATLKLPYSDQRVIHFGLIPRSHRCIFVINELPDLQARIQVSLFNILQEGDMQIRGFKLRMPLDIQFMFTANPEDYTNRGSIITPLKDRIESQILTHYPRTLEVSRKITAQEAKLTEAQSSAIKVTDLCADLLEQISFAARDSEFVDEKSGVSARLSIAGYENLVSAAERRLIINADKNTTTRIGDFWGVVPAITGKVELVYEGEQAGPYMVAVNLMGTAIKNEFLKVFPHPDKQAKDEKDAFGVVRAWFTAGNKLDILSDSSNKDYQKALKQVAGLENLAKSSGAKGDDLYPFMELIIHGLVEFEVLSKEYLETGFSIRDVLADMFDKDMFDGLSN